MSVNVDKRVLEGIDAAKNAGISLQEISPLIDWLYYHEYYATALWVGKNQKEFLKGVKKEGFSAN